MEEKTAEFAILKVAILMTALDGCTDDSEIELFNELLERCNDVDVDEASCVLAAAERARRRLIRTARKQGARAAVERETLSVFQKEVNSLCVWSDFALDSKRVRRAFVMWTAMALSDRRYASIERRAIKLLQRMFNSFPLVSDDFLARSQQELIDINRASDGLRMAKDLKTDRRLHGHIEAGISRLMALVRG